MEKKINKNEGEVQQYYVEGNLEVIIIFDLVLELARRNQRGSHYSGVSVFFNKIRCADCGSWYGSKAWNSTDAYKKHLPLQLQIQRREVSHSPWYGRR